MKVKNPLALIAISLAATTAVIAQNNTLTSFVDKTAYEGWYIERVFYINTSQQILEFFNYGGWELQNPTLNSGTLNARADSALTSYYDSFNIQHVFYIDTNFQVHELYNNGQWWNNQLTGGVTNPKNGQVTGAATNAPRARDQYALTSCFDSRNIEHVFYIDQQAHIRELYNSGQWATDDVSSEANSAAAALASGLTSLCNSSGNPNVFYTDYAHHIRSLQYSNSKWMAGDPTLVADGPAPAFANALSSFIDNAGGWHIVYFDTELNVQELYYANGSWSAWTPGTSTQSLPAAPGSGLSSFVDSSGGQYVFYIDACNALRLIYEDVHWEAADIGNEAGAPPPAPGSALTSFNDTKGAHVFYVDSAAHVIEIDNTPGWWEYNDLSGPLVAPPAEP